MELTVIPKFVFIAGKTIGRESTELVNKISKLRTFDNIDTYYSLHALWDCVPSDYKELNHLEFIGEENLDESLHPTPRGHELWSDKLFDYGKYD